MPGSGEDTGKVGYLNFWWKCKVLSHPGIECDSFL